MLLLNYYCYPIPLPYFYSFIVEDFFIEVGGEPENGYCFRLDD